MPVSNPYLHDIVPIWQAVRTGSLRVHALTNLVAANFTANCLLAIGAEPSLSDDVHQQSAFVQSADGLLINLGMNNPAKNEAIQTALDAAQAYNCPWVLDPVMIHRSDGRKQFAHSLLDYHPAIIRGNLDEMAICGQWQTGAVLAVSGPQDHIKQANETCTIGNGVPLQQNITAMGCALGAIMAACVATGATSMLAAICAHMAFGIAGQRAWAKSDGPGSFVPSFIDALYHLQPSDLQAEGIVNDG